MASSPPSSPLSAAPWLELFDSPHGLGLRVTRDAPAGTALLMERPLAAVTSVGRSRDSSRPRPRPRRRCRRCLALLSLRPPSRIRTCRGCKDSSYCDSDCEEEDKDAHVFSGECELLRRAAEKINEKGETKEAFLPLLREACLALRLLRARPPSAGPLVTHSEELMGGAESGERGRRVWAAAELAARALEAALSPGASGGGGGGGSDADTSHPPPPPLPFEAFHRAASAALCAAIVNSLELRFCDEDEAAGRLDEQKNARARKGKDEDEEDEEDSGLPLAVFAFAARANHSCRPSASFSTRSKGKISLRALRDLRKGEEVTICYLAAGGGDDSSSRRGRRRTGERARDSPPRGRAGKQRRRPIGSLAGQRRGPRFRPGRGAARSSAGEGAPCGGAGSLFGVWRRERRRERRRQHRRGKIRCCAPVSRGLSGREARGVAGEKAAGWGWRDCKLIKRKKHSKKTKEMKHSSVCFFAESGFFLESVFLHYRLQRRRRRRPRPFLQSRLRRRRRRRRRPPLRRRRD